MLIGLADEAALLNSIPMIQCMSAFLESYASGGTRSLFNFITVLMSPIDKRKYLQIGELAKMYDISIQAVRYHDKIEFVKPLYIEANTCYRYYSRNQGFLVRNKKPFRLQIYHR